MEPDDLEERRAKLQRTLDTHNEAERAAREVENARGTGAGMAAAFKLSTEFISGIVVGGVLGYLIDLWLGISPWGMIVLLLLGFAAGILNVLRSAGLIQKPQPGKRPSDGD